MEDDEEYSYAGYSSGTAAHITQGGYIGDDEEFSYSGYGSEEEAAAAASSAKSNYGDFLVEEFSAESAVSKVAKATKISEKAVTYVMALIYLVVGALCVAISHEIQTAFPYIVGGVMIFAGILRFAGAMARGEYKVTTTNSTASSLIFIALGLMIVIESDWATKSFIPVAWGIFGLMEGAHAFNHAFSRISRSLNPTYYLIKGLIEVVLAFMLLYDPSHVHMHIIVFGVQLMFDAITMLPIVKKLVHNKR